MVQKHTVGEPANQRPDVFTYWKEIFNEVYVQSINYSMKVFMTFHQKLKRNPENRSYLQVSELIHVLSLDCS